MAALRNLVVTILRLARAFHRHPGRRPPGAVPSTAGRPEHRTAKHHQWQDAGRREPRPV